LLDLLLVYEVVSDEPLMSELVPWNSLRNFALAQARTPLVAMVNVDFLVSRSLEKWMQKDKK
jgi:hypothetical protein